MSLFNLQCPIKEKSIIHHPWERTVKDIHINNIKYAHNSINNPHYPKKDFKQLDNNKIKFTIIGNRTTRDYVYCVKLVKGLHKYRCKNFDFPIIRGVTSVEWPMVWHNLKIEYGGMAYCIKSQVAILVNDKFLGGIEELKQFIESKYIYHLTLDYYKESIAEFAGFIKTSGRSCAYMHFSINDQHIGTMIFMLYSDIVPHTCENFLRLCKERRGGYSGTPVHRIVKDGWIQCGGFALKSTNLDCENFIIPHDRRGVLGMANDGRHIDCSTQFFVLLQPAPWMAHKYVAFGQLIDGETILKKIESVPTWYESPTSDIKIHQAGIFNMNCQDIMINKGTNAYIQGHIENLFALGELLCEALMEKVFLEIEFRRIAQLDEKKGEIDEVAGEEISISTKNLHATQRFLRKKEEIEKQLAKTSVDVRRPSSAVAEPDNNEFDVEVYEYEPEEYSYKHVTPPETPSLIVKPEKPFYIALTDVPYPDEVDSDYDLKKFLRGDYCLESDLQKDAPRRSLAHKNISFPSELFDLMEDESETESEEYLDSDDEKEIRRYLKLNADRVSFAGGIIKNIARGVGKYNLFEGTRKSELVSTDEELRRFRLASMDQRAAREQEKKVSISAPNTEKEIHKIKRRQTGFVRQEDLEKIHVLHKTSSELLYDKESTTETRKVSISEPNTDREIHRIKRRQTGFVRPEDLEKIHIIHKMSSELLSDNESMTETRKVRIDPLAVPTGPLPKLVRRPTAFIRPPDISDSDAEVHRQSVLVRLYEDVTNVDEHGPTLKDYKPMSETHQKNTLLTFSPDMRITSEEMNKERHLRPSLVVEEDSFEQILNIQHGKKFMRKISSDYVKTIDQVEHKMESSIRSVEFAKTRPSMTVSEYQMKNQKYQEELRNSSRTKVDVTTVITPVENFEEERQSIGGLRLPGDTPLYSMSDDDNQNK